MIKELFRIQREVDLHIVKKIDFKIGKDFSDTLSDRKRAFIVELCELANEIGFFKYWKKSHVKNNERIKDEWADCLAFLNSITITQNYEKQIEYFLNHSVLESPFEPRYHFDVLIKNRLFDLTDLEYAYRSLYHFGTCLGYSVEELNEAYINKSNENIIRAKEGY